MKPYLISFNYIRWILILTAFIVHRKRRRLMLNSNTNTAYLDSFHYYVIGITGCLLISIIQTIGYVLMSPLNDSTLVLDIVSLWFVFRLIAYINIKVTYFENAFTKRTLLRIHRHVRFDEITSLKFVSTGLGCGLSDVICCRKRHVILPFYLEDVKAQDTLSSYLDDKFAHCQVISPRRFFHILSVKFSTGFKHIKSFGQKIYSHLNTLKPIWGTSIFISFLGGIGFIALAVLFVPLQYLEHVSDKNYSTSEAYHRTIIYDHHTISPSIGRYDSSDIMRIYDHDSGLAFVTRIKDSALSEDNLIYFKEHVSPGDILQVYTTNDTSRNDQDGSLYQLVDAQGTSYINTAPALKPTLEITLKFASIAIPFWLYSFIFGGISLFAASKPYRNNRLARIFIAFHHLKYPPESGL